MELVFYYARNYENKPATFLNLSNEHIVTYDEISGNLTIDKNHEYIENFFGKNIRSISAVIGNNGVGKTTLLNNISRTVLEENKGEQLGYFVFLAVYIVNNTIFCYKFGNILPLIKSPQFELANDVVWSNHLKNIHTIFFSQHIEPLYSSNIFYRRKETSKSRRNDISTAYLYYQTSINNSKETSQIAQLFRKEDYKKYIKLFCDVKIGIDLKTPKYINIRILKRYYDFKEFKQHYKNWALEDFIELLDKHRDFSKSVSILHSEILIQCISQLVYKYYYVKEVPELTTFFTKLKKLIVSFSDEENFTHLEVIDRLTKIVPKIGLKLLEDAKTIFAYLSRKEDLYFTYDGFTIDLENGKSKIILQEMNTAGLFNSELDFLEMGFSYSRLENTTFSSGEYSIWSLFSRLYGVRNKFSKNTILLLDEAELNLHPLWQREFIKVLLDFLNTYFPKVKFQIVLTTHSPMLLSDFPKSVVTYLSENSNQSTDSDKFPQTFGSNIHELYSSGFGLDGNLIGGFASSKIQYLVKKLFAMKSLTKIEAEKYLKTIEIIGEGFIKTKLKERVETLLLENELDYLISLKEKNLSKAKSDLDILKKKRKKE